MTIDEQAPAVARAEREIAASPEAVWEVLAAIDRWPDWNPDVKSVTLTGAVTEGTEFTWRAGPVTIASRLEHVERPHVLGWSGKTGGIRSLHVWRLEPADGTTLATTEESWDGALPRLLRGPMRRQLRQALDSGLAYLKAEAERRTGA